MAHAHVSKKGHGLEKLMRLAEQAKHKPFVKVGVLGKTAARTSTEKSKGKPIDNVGLAIVHEFGVPQKRIPSRPFLRSTFDIKKDEWNKLLARLIAKAVKGSISIDDLLGVVGQRASADVKRRITSGGNFAANAPATIARKGSSRPLVDTGRLVMSISYQVVTP